MISHGLPIRLPWMSQSQVENIDGSLYLWWIWAVLESFQPINKPKSNKWLADCVIRLHAFLFEAVRPPRVVSFGNSPSSSISLLGSCDCGGQRANTALWCKQVAEGSGGIGQIEPIRCNLSRIITVHAKRAWYMWQWSGMRLGHRSSKAETGWFFFSGTR